MTNNTGAFPEVIRGTVVNPRFTNFVSQGKMLMDFCMGDSYPKKLRTAFPNTDKLLIQALDSACT